MLKINPLKKSALLLTVSALIFSCSPGNEKTVENDNQSSNVKKSNIELPKVLTIKDIAQNPEGIEYDKDDHTFLLSSLNAGPIIKINLDGTYKPFTNGEPFPVSTAGLQIDYKHNKLLVAGFNGMELMDKDPKTKGLSTLRIYNLKTGVMEKDINLSSLLPDANAYFANDVAVDSKGNAYVSDWYAAVLYKVDNNGKPGIFWRNETGIPSGANGLDFHPDGYLLVSLLSVNKKGLYVNYGLVKIPLNDPKLAQLVKISDPGFTGFDGMVITPNGTVIGVTNNGKTPGGNTLIELSSKDGWKTAEVINSKEISPSTTVAITPESKKFVINQDFTSNDAKNWTIEQIEF